MTEKLKFGRRAPRSGKVRNLVVFLHGYGADGADLLGLADPLGPHLPDTLFLAPDAPEPCKGNGFGRQWFPIPWLDGSTEAAALTGLESSARALDGFLDDQLRAEGLNDSQLALFGFSQGTMMALHVAPRRSAPVAGVVGFSGRLLHPERLLPEATSKPPVLLVHGDADPVVPFDDMGRAGQVLAAAGFDTYGHVMKGAGHTIAPDGLSVALGFLHKRFLAA